jgi:outer membrane protein assembly factor BamB
MDSDARVTAFNAKTGARVWRAETEAEDDRSTNVGGGLSTDGHTLFATTGRGEAVAFEAASGKVVWRKSLTTAARGAATFADGKLFVPTLDDTVVALSAADGSRLWSHQATTTDTAVLGEPAPAYADGLVVAGFGSGDLIALRAASGTVAWADSLASANGRNSLIDLSSVRGLPVIHEGAVFAGSLGGLLLSLDLRTGRRLWQREVATDQTPCVVGDWVFIVSAEQQIAALSRSDGAVTWLTQLPRFADEEKRTDPLRWLGPIAVGDRLIVAGTNESALSVNPYNGKILGEQKLRGAASVAPSFADGTLFIITDDGTIAAFR